MDKQDNQALQTNKNTEKKDTKPEEEVIYYVLIREMFKERSGKLFLIDNQTETFSKIGGNLENTLKFINREMKEKTVNDIVFEDFKEKNKAAIKISDLTACGEQCILVDHLEINHLLNRSNGWEQLYEKYPLFSSLITFSQVGFDEQGTKALVYMGYSRGWKSGAGFYFLLIKEDTWKIKEKINVWVS